MASTLYTAEILRLATSIPHVGRIPDAAGHDERRAPVCGSRIAIDLDLDEAGMVSRLGLDVRACALGQAATYLLASHVIGRGVADIAMASDELARWLSEPDAPQPDWPGVEVLEPARAYPARHGAICLPFAAAAAAAQMAATNDGDKA